ncbi:MAG TPA: PQQ-binding-like beta-propeller repeat protein [Phycisphaerae bacterium]|nr:PQQ-binding-like beta-propeller repeat protein [Phycisphaerae bacterium]
MRRIRLMQSVVILLFGLAFGIATAAENPNTAAARDQAGRILNATGVTGGLVVHVGCDTGRLTASLRANDRYLVQGLTTDSERLSAARDYIRSKGLYGKVSVATWDGGSLPYVDNLVNLLVISGSVFRPPHSEIERVLAPRGVAIVDGKMTVKKVPPEIDDWSHHMYDATGIGTGNDTAVSRPRSMQWKAGPEYGRSHENMSSVSAVVSAGGRVFSIMDEGPTASLYLPARWFLSARDAFSGVLLWKIPIDQWHAGLFPLKSGPVQLPRRLVATRDRVYVTLALDAPVSELDAATGKVLATFKDTAHAEELLYSGGKLIVVSHVGQGVRPYQGRLPAGRPGFVLEEKAIDLTGSRLVTLIDTATGKTAWKTSPGPVVPLTTAVDAGKILFLSGDQLVCAEMTNGKTLWARRVAPKAVGSSTAHSPTLLVHKGIVYVALGGKLTARDVKTGSEMWSAPCATAGYQAPAGIFIVKNLIWDVNTGGEPYRPGSNRNAINRTYTGYDLRTGEALKQIPVSSNHGYAIMHHRCHVPRASGRYIVTSFPGIEFFDVDTGKSTHDSWIRGACVYGFMPANGLLYTPPHPCACYTQGKLTGFWAVAGKRKSSAVGGQSDRLEKGPAFAKAAADKPAAGEWATYRGDAARSGTTKVSVPVAVKEVWRTDIGGNLSQCVIADGRLFVASVDDHTVHALDVANGRELWNYTAGGRVDSAPTVCRGTVIFGSRDGYVYCLTADKGELVWRFRAAATDRRSVVYDQVESVWPVHGSVLIQDDVLWFCAGRSSYLDGGLLVYRLNPRTGEVLSVTRVDSLGPDDEQPPITSSMTARLDMEGAKNDVLSCDGDHVFMRHWAFDRNGKSIEQNIDHLFSPTGFMDTSWFRRTYWIYGRVYVSGAQGWARTGNVRPTGRIMSIDKDRIYGFGRDRYPPSPGAGHQMYVTGEKEVFFAAARTGDGAAPPTAETKAAAPKTRRSTKGNGKPGASAGKNYEWATSGDIQVRGMVLAGEGKDKRLIVTGAKGDWVVSHEAYEGKMGNLVRVISIADGKTIAEHNLPGLPVFDGMSAAEGRLYVPLEDGSVICLGGKPTATR